MISWLETTDGPRLARSNSDLSDVRSAWLSLPGRKWINLDGRLMRDWPNTYARLAEAFELPDYFGENLDALRDCLTEQDVLQGTAFVVYVDHASEALKDANSDALAGLLDTLTVVAEELAEPVQEGQQWDRPAIPFHVLLANAADDERLLGYSSTPDSPPSTLLG